MLSIACIVGLGRLRCAPGCRPPFVADGAPAACMNRAGACIELVRAQAASHSPHNVRWGLHSPRTAAAPPPPQVHDRPHAFDIRLEDGQTIYSRAEEAAASSSEGLPQYSDLFARLRAAGVQAAA